MAEFRVCPGNRLRSYGGLLRVVIAIGMAPRECARSVSGNRHSSGIGHRAGRRISPCAELGCIVPATEPRCSDPENSATPLRLPERHRQRVDLVAGRHGNGRVERRVGRIVESVVLAVAAFSRSLNSIRFESVITVRWLDCDDGGIHQRRSGGFPIGRDSCGYDRGSLADLEAFQHAGRLRRTSDPWNRSGRSVHFFGELSAVSALAILLAPLLCWATEIRLLRHRKPWIVGSVRLVLVAIPLMLVLTEAKSDFDRDMAPLLVPTSALLPGS